MLTILFHEYQVKEVNERIMGDVANGFACLLHEERVVMVPNDKRVILVQAILIASIPTSSAAIENLRKREDMDERCNRFVRVTHQNLDNKERAYVAKLRLSMRIVLVYIFENWPICLGTIAKAGDA